MCTGQQPLSAPLLALSADILTASGHARVLPTMQLADPRFAHIFALGDVADTGAQKSARAAFKQGLVASENIWRVHRKEAGALAEYKPESAGIHMSLGFVSSRDMASYMEHAAMTDERTVLGIDDRRTTSCFETPQNLEESQHTRREMTAKRIWGLCASGR